MNEPIVLKFKYNYSDIKTAINYKMAIMYDELLSKGYRRQYYLMKLIKPFVIFGAWLMKFKTLKNTVSFEICLSHLFAKTKGKEKVIEWSRFSNYIDTQDFIMLQHDKTLERGDGQALFPKKYFKNNELNDFISILETNDIYSGSVDLNMNI